MTSVEHESAQGTLDFNAVRVLLTIPEAARALAIGRSTLYELIGSGDVEVVHIGRSCRVPVDAIGRYVDALRARPGKPS